MDQPPSVGRIVHFVGHNPDAGGLESDDGKKCFAAVIIDVDRIAPNGEPGEELCVFVPGTSLVQPMVMFAVAPFDERGTRDLSSWHWPEKV